MDPFNLTVPESDYVYCSSCGAGLATVSILYLYSPNAIENAMETIAVIEQA